MNKLESDLKNALIPDILVIRDVPDAQLDEWKQSHPAKQYLKVVRVGP